MAGIANLLRVPNLVSKAGESDLSTLAGKVVLLYFSASWCPPCRAFTPKLVEFYQKHHATKNFEVVFVTWDEEKEDFEGYFAKMPWKALPFDEVKAQELTKHFNVESIPTLIAVDSESAEIITRNARRKVEVDGDAKDFPWKE